MAVLAIKKKGGGGGGGKEHLAKLDAESLGIERNLNLLILLLTWSWATESRGTSLPNGNKRWEQPSWWGNSSLGMKLSVSKQRKGQIEEPLIEWSSPNMRFDWIKEMGHHDGFRIETTTMPLCRRIKGTTTPSALMSISQELLWSLPIQTHSAPCARRIYNRSLCYTCIYLLFRTNYRPINPV